MNQDTSLAPAPAARIWLLMLGLWLLIAVVTATTLWQFRKTALQAQARELDLLCLALGDNIDRGLEGVEEGVQALRDELRGAFSSGPAGDPSALLARRASLMPLVDNLGLLDPQGRALPGVGALPGHVIGSFAPDELSQLAHDGVALSRPFANAASAQPSLALAMTLPGSGAIGGGWIVATLSTARLLGTFGHALGSADTGMAVLRGDGSLLAGIDPPAPGATLPSAQTLQRWRDPREHLVSQRTVARYGVNVMVSRRLEAALAEWQSSVTLACTGLLMLLAIMVAAVLHGLRSARLRSEAQHQLLTHMARTRKLDALVLLANGVAHDFNSVLTGIQGWCGLARDAAPADGEQARHLDNVLRATQRGRSLVARILTFGRGGAQAPRVFEVEPLVQEVLELVAGSGFPGVRLEVSLRAPGARLRGEPSLVYEALMNLCTNAAQAMPGGGRLGVEMDRHVAAVPQVLSHSTLHAGRHLVLTVTDEGRGIAADVMERLFEPYFTTRAEQRGTGLGLAMVHGVVTELQGAIDVDSAPGRGARFSLYLPEVDAPRAADSGSDTSARTEAG